MTPPSPPFKAAINEAKVQLDGLVMIFKVLNFNGDSLNHNFEIKNYEKWHFVVKALVS